MNASPSPQPAKARTFRVIGWLFLVAALILGISFTPLAAIVPLFLGYTCLRRAKKFALGASDRRDLAQTVPPVGIREQDALGHVFRKIGPYVALGKPGEEAAELGSTKLYVPNESWQKTILDYFAKSRLIIFRAGQTEGLRWELNELVKSVDPSKVVMILPVRDDAYSRFLEWANTILPSALPRSYPDSRVAVFDDKWRPSYLVPGRTLTKTFAPFFARNRVAIKETFWEQILEHNGLRW